MNIQGVSYRRRLYFHIQCPDYLKSHSVTLDTTFCTHTHNSRKKKQLLRIKNQYSLSWSRNSRSLHGTRRFITLLKAQAHRNKN